MEIEKLSFEADIFTMEQVPAWAKKSRGEKLSFEAAIARYGFRFTLEHVPAWALRPLGGKYYGPQYRTDREWYDASIFPPAVKFCQSSNPSYPLGKWLDAPYVILGLQ